MSLIPIAAAHLLGYVAAWFWVSRDRTAHKPPDAGERIRWLSIALVVLTIQQAIVFAGWHLPTVLVAGVIGGMFGLILLSDHLAVVDDLDDDEPMGYDEAKRLAIVASTFGGCLLAFVVLFVSH